MLCWKRFVYTTAIPTSPPTSTTTPTPTVNENQGYVMIGYRMQCSSPAEGGIWFNSPTKDPEFCMALVLNTPGCSDTYFSWAAEGNADCYCPPAGTICTSELYSDVTVNVYRILGDGTGLGGDTHEPTSSGILVTEDPTDSTSEPTLATNEPTEVTAEPSEATSEPS